MNKRRFEEIFEKSKIVEKEKLVGGLEIVKSIILGKTYKIISFGGETNDK